MVLNALRSSVPRLGVFSVVLVLGIAAFVFLSMSQRVQVSHLPSIDISTTRGVGAPRLGALRVVKPQPSYHRRMLPFINPFLGNTEVHDRDLGNVDSLKDNQDSAFGWTNHTPILLIVGYLRTGSTFTASLFAEQPKTFYVFEPLHMMDQMVARRHILRYINGTIRHFNMSMTRASPADHQTSLQHWMHCGFHEVDRDSLEDSFHLSYSKSMRPFVMCIRQRMARLRRGFSFAIKECLPPISKNCATAKLRVFKTIRLRMATAEKLMRLNPYLKIIHLVRDPRGMLFSHKRHTLVKKDKETESVQKFCSNMAADIAVSRRLIGQERAPNLHVIRYEDIAYEPLEQLEVLYKFMNMTVNKRIRDYVVQSTSMNVKDGCMYCTRRGNSTRTANNWRDRINSSYVEVIDRYCGNVYKDLGYFQLGIGDIRNHSIPSLVSKSLYDMFLQDGDDTL